MIVLSHEKSKKITNKKLFDFSPAGRFFLCQPFSTPYTLHYALKFQKRWLLELVSHEELFEDVGGAQGTDGCVVQTVIADDDV